MKAVKLYEKFNNKPVRKFKTVNINISKNLVDLGKAVAVCYRSNKEGMSRDYEHKFRDGVRLLSTDDGKTLIITGGKLNTTDWIRG